MRENIRYDFLYGKKTIPLFLPSNADVQLIESKARTVRKEQADIVKEALLNPIGSATLGELSKCAKNILIITNDNTRPMPSAVTLPAIIGALYREPTDYDITVLIANGLHRQMTLAEQEAQLGAHICKNYKVINHDATDDDSLASFGMLSTGNELFLNKLILRSDLIISEGFIEPHFFAGFSGGRKSILPGIAGATTIMRNHSPDNISNPCSIAANLKNNPIHMECEEASKAAGLKFILNVALDCDKNIIAAFAGDPVFAHQKGCEFVERTMSVSARPSDIVFISNNGYPLDRNFYQAIKGIDTASKAANEGGIVVIAARCCDGVGHSAFEQLILSARTKEELFLKMSAPPLAHDKWQVQIFARALMRCDIIFVNDSFDKEQARQMFVTCVDTLNQALDLAFERKGATASITLIPDGPVMIPVIENA